MVEVADPTEARALVAEAEALAGRLAGVRQAIGRVIFGQDQVVERTLITLLAGGHVPLAVEMEGAAVADESEIRKDVEVEESLETSFRKVVGALWSRLLS